MVGWFITRVSECLVCSHWISQFIGWFIDVGDSCSTRGTKVVTPINCCFTNNFWWFEGSHQWWASLLATDSAPLVSDYNWLTVVVIKSMIKWSWLYSVTYNHHGDHFNSSSESRIQWWWIIFDWQVEIKFVIKWIIIDWYKWVNGFNHHLSH